MNALLVRVAADQTKIGGGWNGPINGKTREFAYVAIRELADVREEMERPYRALSAALEKFRCSLPSHLDRDKMHLDPDFEYLTYGDSGSRADQIRGKVGQEDLLVFYGGLKDVQHDGALIYAIIGIFVIKEIIQAIKVPQWKWDHNAHTRRVAPGRDEIVVRGRANGSGRLQRCLPIGEYRNGAYRVTRHLLQMWGGLEVRDGYVQRSGRLPKFKDAARFYKWFLEQSPVLLQQNN